MKRSSSWYLPGLGLESHEEDYEPAQAHEELLSKPVQEDVTKSECYVNGLPWERGMKIATNRGRLFHIHGGA